MATMQKDLTGHQFEHWTVIVSGEKTRRSQLYLCRCVCGKEKNVCGRALVRRESKSCGCRGRSRALLKPTPKPPANAAFEIPSSDAIHADSPIKARDIDSFHAFMRQRRACSTAFYQAECRDGATMADKSP